MIFEPYRRAARTASRIVASSVTPMTVITSAPAFAAISTSNAPVSIVLRSATIVLPGNDFLSCRTTSMPSDLTRGVPASSQSAPPSTVSFAASRARLRCMWSRATCNTGSIERTYLAVSIKTYLPRRPQSRIYRRPRHRRLEGFPGRADPAAPSEREGREMLQHGLEHADGRPEVRRRRARDADRRERCRRQKEGRRHPEGIRVARRLGCRRDRGGPVARSDRAALGLGRHADRSLGPCVQGRPRVSVNLKQG